MAKITKGWFEWGCKNCKWEAVATVLEDGLVHVAAHAKLDNHTPLTGKQEIHEVIEP